MNTSSQLRPIVEGVLHMLEPRLEAEGVVASLDVPDGLEVDHSRAVRLAVFQLIAHAMESMPDGGDLLVAAVAGSDDHELEVADSGLGVLERRLSLRDPLAEVRRLAAGFGGSVELINCAQGGLARILRVPRAQQRRAAA